MQEVAQKSLVVNKEDLLLWNVNEIKELFSVYKLWPTFIGTSLTNDRKEIGRLPVLLWSEQLRFLKKKQMERNERTNLKRKRVDNNDNEIQDNEKDSINSDDGDDVIDDGDDDSFSINTAKKARPSYWSHVWSQMKSMRDIFLPKNNSIQTHNNSTSNQDHEKDGVNQERREESNRKFQIQKEDYVIGNIRQLIFEDLLSPTGIRSIWEKENESTTSSSSSSSGSSGYLIGPGDVYGGDYTIYPTSDPSTSHAIATINVLSTPTISIKELLAFSRVQNQVGKKCVYAFADQEIEINNHPSQDHSSSSSSTTTTTTIELKYLSFTFHEVGDRF